MLKNYIITAFRNLLRNRAYTFINVLGLSLGIGAALVLFKMTLFEKSFDKYHTHYDDIYRFVREEVTANNIEREPGVPNPFRGAFINDYPDFGLTARTLYFGDGQVSARSQSGQLDYFNTDEGFAFADNDFFKIFDYDFILGDAAHVLEKPQTVALSRSEAIRLFGVKENELNQVIGQELNVNNKLKLSVTGIFEDSPENTMLPFSIIIDYESIDGFFEFFAKESWTSTSGNAHVYLLKAEGVEAEQIKAVLPAFGAKYLGEEGENTRYYLQKYSDIHFQTEYGTYDNRTVAPETLVVPILIGLFLILTACVNFINLATAQAVRRSKEVGIRKVLGGQKKQLAIQFLGETFFLTLVSVIISLGIAELAMQNLPETILKYDLSLDLAHDFQLLTIIVSILVVVTFMAGGYPAMILSSMKPSQALKGKGSSAMAGKSTLRRGLVIFQFFTSQVLVIGTLVVISQMNFFLSADLGFRRNSVINFRLPESSLDKINLIRSELSRNARISNVSFAFTSPRSDTNIGTTFNYAPLASEVDFDLAVKIIDENFIPLYDIELLAGRNLTAADTTLKRAVVSETLINIMNIKDPEEAIGKVIDTGFSGEKTIVGVFRDFHSNTLKSEMAPLLMLNFPIYYRVGSISFEGSESETADIIASMKSVWNKQFPEYVFNHQIYSELLEADYAQEAETLDLFQLFSAIAILIGCLGLYGLISFMANQKTKEIGVRKVLGASVTQILKLFSSELLILIGISFLLAAPVAYWLSSSWLQDFKYSINIDAWVFVIAIGLTFLVSALTTGLRSLKAAKANPVDSLRSE